MRTLYSWFIAVACVMMGIQAQAYPNLNATTGLLAIPTASVVEYGDFIGAADMLFHDDTTINGRVIFGLTDRLEIGAGVIAGEDTAIGINAKYALPGNVAGFTPAIGLTVITGDAVDDGTQVYFVGTRAFTAKQQGAGSVIGTVGINFTNIDTASAFRPFAGAQFRIGNRTEIAGEYVLATGDFSRSIHSLFIRHSMNDRWSAQAGYTNAFGFTGSTDNNLFLGTAYSWENAAN
ncbi:MAG: hypothetical protein ACYDBB_08980 [Armatimonadota bacterium]